ncbi:hypothetical protein X749_03650 [Mesorhizobium sp. LNJC391B00]|nr:hypothetical protein X749_03650 [Mesorhizobium sp. LNJC391B00]
MPAALAQPGEAVQPKVKRQFRSTLQSEKNGYSAVLFDCVAFHAAVERQLKEGHEERCQS